MTLDPQKVTDPSVPVRLAAITYTWFSIARARISVLQ
jgi:hypothetical protein